jgi:hypothetical protein
MKNIKIFVVSVWGLSLIFNPASAKESQETIQLISSSSSHLTLGMEEKLYYYETTLSLIEELNSTIGDKESQKRAKQIKKTFESFNKFKFKLENEIIGKDDFAEWGTFTSILPYLVKSSIEGLLKSLESSVHQKSFSFFLQSAKKNEGKMKEWQSLRDSSEALNNTLNGKAFGKIVTKTNVSLEKIYDRVQDVYNKYQTYQQTYEELKNNKKVTLLSYFCCPLGWWSSLD